MQTHSKHIRNRPILLLGLAASGLLAVALGWSYFGTSALSTAGGSPKVSAAVPVTVETVRKMDVPRYLNSLGVVRAFNTVTVRTQVDGIIEKIAFTEGQIVKKGDILAQIDPRLFQGPLDQAIAKQKQDQANLDNAKLDFERSAKLGEFAARQTVDTQKSNVNQLTALVDADQAAVENARTTLDHATIRSPIAGRAGFRLVDQGNVVHAADQTGIVTIAQIQPIAVIFTEPEDQLPLIAKRLSAGPLKVIAQSSDGKTDLAEGELTVIDNAVDERSGSIKLKAVFANDDNALWPGRSVSTRLLIETLTEVIVVPDTAVQRNAKGFYAYVVGADSKVELRNMDVALIADGRAVVKTGLSDGEMVVTAGQYRLQPGVVIAPKNADSEVSSSGEIKQ